MVSDDFVSIVAVLTTGPYVRQCRPLLFFVVYVTNILVIL